MGEADFARWFQQIRDLTIDSVMFPLEMSEATAITAAYRHFVNGGPPLTQVGSNEIRSAVLSHFLPVNRKRV